MVEPFFIMQSCCCCQGHTIRKLYVLQISDTLKSNSDDFDNKQKSWISTSEEIQQPVGFLHFPLLYLLLYDYIRLKFLNVSTLPLNQTTYSLYRKTEINLRKGLFFIYCQIFVIFVMLFKHPKLMDDKSFFLHRLEVSHLKRFETQT